MIKTAWARWWRSIWAGARVTGGGRANGVKGVYEGLSWVKHLLHMSGLRLSPCWRIRVCLSHAVCLCACVSAHVAACQRTPLCLSIYVSVPAARARALLFFFFFFCTPTVACGTVIFVSATLVTFCKGPRTERAKQTQTWLIPLVFPLYFQDTARESLIQRQHLDTARLEMNQKPI